MSRWIRRGYTDVFVVVGLDLRDANQTYSSLKTCYPERLLGYDVLITIPDARKLQGLRVSDYFISTRALNESDDLDLVQDCLEASKLLTKPRPTVREHY